MSETKIMLKEVYTFKLKPVYNFQSIEVEFVGTKEDLMETGLTMYEEILRGLQIATDSVIEAPTKRDRRDNIPKEPLATDGQKKIMSMYGIEFTNKTTKAEATKLITANMEKCGKN